MNPTTAEYTPVTQAKQVAADELLEPDSFCNVLAVGTGNRDPACLRIYVQNKLAPGVDKIKKDDLGVSTCVMEIGRLGRLNRGPAERTGIGPGFPIRFNTTAPNVNSRACGTLGATVQYGESYYILSSSSVATMSSP
jgi:hypothetical protein